MIDYDLNKQSYMDLFFFVLFSFGYQLMEVTSMPLLSTKYWWSSRFLPMSVFIEIL